MRFLLVTLLLSSFLSISQAQTGNEIVSKHIEAIGGMERLKGVRNIMITGTMTFTQGENSQDYGFMQVQTQNGKVYFELRDRNAKVLNIQAFDGQTAWTGTETQSTVITGNERLELIHTPFLSRFLDEDKYARNPKYTGLISQDHWLSMEDQLDRTITVMINKDTFYQVGEIYEDLEGKVIIYTLSNFKTFNDIVFPTSIAYRRDLDSDNNSKTTVSTEIQRITQKILDVRTNLSIPGVFFKRPEDK